MTDEEKAEKKYQEHINKESCYVSKSDEEIYTDGFLDGLAEGKPKWHDLRKNPGDLPKSTGEYWCKWNDGTYCTEHYFGECFGDYVIAWCEIPKFEEKK